MTELPLILAVDEDAEALERITGELQRYERDYRVICGPSTEAALAQLEALHEHGEAVAIVLAARGTGALKGEELLVRVHDLHPHAKRALLIPWGGWADEETASAIRNAMALGHIDYYALKPFSAPDELFHRLISEFLEEWRRQNAPGRRELTVVADPCSARGYALRNQLARNGVPHAFHTPDSAEGEGVPRRLRPARGRGSGRGARGRNAARGSGARGSRAARDAHAHRDRPHRAPVRRRDRRRGPGRPCRCGLRLVGRARCARRRARHDRRAGRLEHPHPQLPRLLARPERSGAHAAGLPASMGVRRHLRAPAGGRGDERSRTRGSRSPSRVSAGSRRGA